MPSKHAAPNDELVDSAAVTHGRAAKPRRKRGPRKRRGKRPNTLSESAALHDSALRDRLRHHALGGADMTATQLRAAEFVLKSAKAADEPENPAVRATVSAEPLSEEEWERKYCNPSPIRIG